MSGKAIRETLTALGVIASMVFVGWEIRTSNVQARAAAYQEIGIATAEIWAGVGESPQPSVLFLESLDPDLVAAWEADDWAQNFAVMTGWARLAETALLQVEQGLLPPDAMERLGYSGGPDWLNRFPAFTCMWPSLRGRVGTALRERMEGARTEPTFDCEELNVPSYFR